jgi:chemotaxis protein CheD
MLHPGEIYATKDRAVISTLLGSCIAVCLRDEDKRINGMNHFLLPGTEGNIDFKVNAAGRYGISSMENLINRMLHLGASKNRITAKIFGGGNIMPTFKTDIGKKNIDFVKWFMKNEKIPIIGEDIGEKVARKIYFFTIDGNVYVEVITTKKKDVAKEEVNYFQRARKHLDDSDITIF